MTPEALRSLIAGAETLDVEFKGEEARALPDGDLVEAIVCLANRSGNAPGWLLVGSRSRWCSSTSKSVVRSAVARSTSSARLSPPQAYRLLKRLEKGGKIRQTSDSTKGVPYGSASK